MKGIFIAIVLVSVLASFGQAHPKGDEGGLGATLARIGNAIGRNLQDQINAALTGEKPNNEALTAELKTFAEGIPLLPNPVYLRGNLNNAFLRGVENLVPNVKLDIIRKTLDVKWTLPQAVFEGDYSLDLSAAEDFQSLMIANGFGLGRFAFNDLQLDINAKLKGTLITGWRIDYLNYTIAPFSIDSDLDNVLLFNNVPVEDYVAPFLNWYLHKELVALEEGAHEPLITFITTIIDKILCPICSN
jgi:hypothetical protein